MLSWLIANCKLSVSVTIAPSPGRSFLLGSRSWSTRGRASALNIYSTTPLTQPLVRFLDGKHSLQPSELALQLSLFLFSLLPGLNDQRLIGIVRLHINLCLNFLRRFDFLRR